MKNSKIKDFFKYSVPYFFKHTIFVPFICIKNWLFCLKYPFWKSRNVWTDKPCGYSFTKYEEIPYGWRKAFGKQLSKELKEALIKDNNLKTFRFTQIKEKFGDLRLYTNGVGPETKKIIDKYELLSRGYCIECGKPARYCTHGWIEYYCENCYEEHKRQLDCSEEELIELTKDERLKKEDIPEITILSSKDKETTINIKQEYGIDFETLWGLKDDKNS